MQMTSSSNYHSSLLAVQAAAFPYTAIIAEEGLVPKATIRLSGCVNISSFSSQLSLRNRVPGRPTHRILFLNPRITRYFKKNYVFTYSFSSFKTLKGYR